MEWSSITIENYEPPHTHRTDGTGGIEWIAIDIEGEEYSGFWQKGNPLTDKEVKEILSILVSKTNKLYTEKDWGI